MVWVIALLSGVGFISVASTSMVSLAVPFIAQAFGVSGGVSAWVVTAYAASFGIGNAVCGRLADRFGRRRLYIAGMLALGLTSLALAWSPSIEIMVVLRVIQGVGASALPVAGFAIIAHLVPSHERGRALGTLLAVLGVSGSIAPFVGGVLLELVGWRAILGFPGLVLLAVPAALKWLPDELNQVKNATFDAVGALLLGIGVLMLSYSFDAMGRIAFIPRLGAAGIAFLWFAIWIRRHDKPFVSPLLLQDRRYMGVLLVGFLLNATRLGIIVLVPMLLSDVNRTRPLNIGMVVFPGALAIALVSRFAGKLSDQRGARFSVVLGMVSLIAGVLVIAMFVGGSPYGVAMGMTFYGIGFGIAQSPLMSAATRLVQPAHVGIGIGIFMMTFFVGGAFGVALATTSIDLQVGQLHSWLGFHVGLGASYSNTFLLISGITVAGLLFCCLLPDASVRTVGRPAPARQRRHHAGSAACARRRGPRARRGPLRPAARGPGAAHLLAASLAAAMAGHRAPGPGFTNRSRGGPRSRST